MGLTVDVGTLKLAKSRSIVLDPFGAMKVGSSLQFISTKPSDSQ